MKEYRRVADNLFIRVKTGRYYAIINKNKRRATKSLRTTVRSIANARLNNLRLKIGAATLNPSARDVPTVAQAIEQALEQASLESTKGKMSEMTYKGIKWHLDLVAKSPLGSQKINQVRSQALKDYLDGRRLDQSARTAQVDMTHLRRLFNLAKERGWRWDNPVEELPSYKHTTKKIRIPEPAEIAKVLTYLRSHPFHFKNAGRKAADFIEFLCLSGCRVQGAQTIRWEDIDFEKGTMVVTEKGKKTRTVDLFEGLRRFLTERRQSSGLLFPGTPRKGRKGSSLMSYNPKKILREAFVATKVAPFTFHSCRHFFATQCLEQNISASTIAGWLGHVDNGILVMRLYGNHLQRRHFASEAQKVRIALTPSTPIGAPSSVDPIGVNVGA
jgi:integrase